VHDQTRHIVSIHLKTLVVHHMSRILFYNPVFVRFPCLRTLSLRQLKACVRLLRPGLTVAYVIIRQMKMPNTPRVMVSSPHSSQIAGYRKHPCLFVYGWFCAKVVHEWKWDILALVVALSPGRHSSILTTLCGDGAGPVVHTTFTYWLSCL
jgi:hypothetical protein